MHKKPLVKLLQGLLGFNPQKRITATIGLNDINFRRFIDTSKENKIIETDSALHSNHKLFSPNRISLINYKGKTLQEYRECLYTEILKERDILCTGMYQK